MPQSDDFQKRILDSVKNDLTSGAMELTLEVLGQLAQYMDFLHKESANECRNRLISLTEAIKHLRPCMVPLQNTMNEWQQRAERVSGSDRCQYIKNIHEIIGQLQHEAQSRQTHLRQQAVKALSHVSTAITISRSSSVVTVFKNLPQKPLKFIVCESRPGFEGKTLAMELAQEDVLVEYIVDAGISNHIRQADAAIVGADCILNDGSVVNKCGTSLLALAARHYNVPFYVVADSGKCATWGIEDLNLEEMPVAQLAAPKSPWIKPFNYYFDVTDANLISAYLMESGEQKCWPWQVQPDIEASAF